MTLSAPASRAALAALFLLTLAAARLADPASGFAPPQAPPALVGRVETAFGEGDARTLGTSTSDRVQVSLLGNSRVYSRAQATYVLERFFSDYPPRRFRFEHRMGSGRDAYFATGRYTHADGDMTVMVRLGTRGPDWEVREVRIETGVLE